MDEFSGRLDAAKRASVGQLLFKAARLWNEDAVERVRAQGAHGFKVAHTQLFPHIALEGTRATELAKRTGITKQAVGQLVDELVAMGVLERLPDPDDGRAQLVKFTARGQQGLLDGLAVLQVMERELALRIGPERIARMHDDLLALIDALEGSDPP